MPSALLLIKPNYKSIMRINIKLVVSSDIWRKKWKK